jgi:hypothetical protein
MSWIALRRCKVSDTQKWYTPKEFVESNEIIKSDSYALQEYTNIVLHYPKNAISWHKTRAQQSQKDFDSFLERVMNAFELHPIGKGKQSK